MRGLAGLGSVSPNKMDMVALYYPIHKLFFDPTMVCNLIAKQDAFALSSSLATDEVENHIWLLAW